MVRSMKILQVCPRYYPDIGGAEEHIRNISERLAEKHDVSVFTTDPSRKLPREEEINGVNVRRFGSFAPNEAFYFSLGIVGELKKSVFDVVHGHGFHSFPFFFSRCAKTRKFVVTTRYHGSGHTSIRNFLFSLYKPLGMRILRDADDIICISNYEKNLLLSHFKIEKEKVRVIPNGITKNEFANLKKGDKRSHRTILCVARLEKYKGIHYLIEVLPKLDEDICLQIVGKGPYKNELVKLANKPVKSRVKFYQDLPRKELLQLYANADLFVSLSKYEAFGNTISEALASRTPCIVADTSALSEWIDGKNCFGIDYPIDVDVLVKSINKVIGREVEGVNLLDWDDVVKELETIYQFI